MEQEDEMTRRALDDARRGVLEQLDDWLETPMLVLGFVWLGLLIVELVGNLTPALELAGAGVWVIFLLDFLLKFALAPKKNEYLKSNWLTVLALIVPALRVFRIFFVS